MRPSWNTHAFYRKYTLPAMREYMGFERDHEAHAHLIAGFYGLDPRGPLPSMADMSQEEAGRFLAWVDREAAEAGRILEDPRKRDTRK